MSLSSDSLASRTTELYASLLLLSLKSHKHCQTYSACDFSRKLNFCRSISMLFSSLAQQIIESTRCREKPVAKSSPVINVSCERLPASCIRYCNKLSLRNLAFFPSNLLLSLQLVVLFPETERFNSFSKLDWWSIFLHFSLHTHSLAPQVHKQIHFSAQISQHVCRIGFWDGIAVNDF